MKIKAPRLFSLKGAFMTENDKNRLKKYFEELLDDLEDGEIREIPIIECVDAKDGDDDAV